MLPSPSQLSWYRGEVMRRRTALVIDAGAEAQPAVARVLGASWRVFAVPTLDDAWRFLGGVLVDAIVVDGALLAEAGPAFRDQLARSPRLAAIPVASLASLIAR